MVHLFFLLGGEQDDFLSQKIVKGKFTTRDNWKQNCTVLSPGNKSILNSLVLYSVCGQLFRVWPHHRHLRAAWTWADLPEPRLSHPGNGVRIRPTWQGGREGAVRASVWSIQPVLALSKCYLIHIINLVMMMTILKGSGSQLGTVLSPREHLPCLEALLVVVTAKEGATGI